MGTPRSTNTELVMSIAVLEKPRKTHRSPRNSYDIADRYRPKYQYRSR